MRVMVLVLVCGLVTGVPEAWAKTAAQMVAETVVKAIRTAKKADKMIQQKNGYVRVNSRKKLKAACKDVKDGVEVHVGSVAMYTKMYRTMMQGGGMGRAMAKEYIRYAIAYRKAVQASLPVHIRCQAAIKRVRVYISVAAEGERVTLTAKRWSRRDRIRIRKALKPSAKKLGIRQVSMVDESGASKGTHRL